jgi:hypothetical protein
MTDNSRRSLWMVAAWLGLAVPMDAAAAVAVFPPAWRVQVMGAETLGTAPEGHTVMVSEGRRRAFCEDIAMEAAQTVSQRAGGGARLRRFRRDGQLIVSVFQGERAYAVAVRCRGDLATIVLGTFPPATDDRFVDRALEEFVSVVFSVPADTFAPAPGEPDRARCPAGAPLGPGSGCGAIVRPPPAGTTTRRQ